MTDDDPTDPTELAELENAAPAGLGGLDLGSLLGMAQDMQAQMAESHDRVAATIVEGGAGGGAVVVAVTGAYEFQSVTIRPDAVDPDDHSMLEDLVLAALRDAASKVAALQADANPLAGLGDSFGGLFGGT
jgi:DNA-binding YbaB/EbfC family protein